MATNPKNGVRPVTFKDISQDDLPQGRKGKHHAIVARLLHDIEKLKAGRALKIQMSELPDSMANIRSALNRASKQRSLEIETASDDDYFYVWKTEQKRNGART
jgi:hypothetical protein